MTASDQELLLFIAAQEVALAEQAAALTQITPDEATARFQQFRDRGWLTRVQLKSQRPAAYRVTRDGAEQIDSSLPPLRPLDPGRYRHEIGIGWLWVTARDGQLGQLREVLTRREMQAADATLRTESLLNTPGARFADQPTRAVASDARDLYPDLALVQSDDRGGWVTLDVVLTLPERERMRTKLTRHHRDPLIRAQLFLAEDEDGQITKLINTIADELALTDHVHVQQLATDGIAGT